MSNGVLHGGFCKHGTTMSDIRHAGYRTVASSGGSWWFEKRDKEGRLEDRVFIPMWIHEIIEHARECSRIDAQNHMRASIGLEPLPYPEGQKKQEPECPAS